MAALKANRLMWRAALASVVVNAAADAFLMRYLGVAGIAAADSIAALVTLLLLAVMLSRHTARNAAIVQATSSV
jgi:peptidoglycan biosynthesis protein MviN/MurJ (putative lipid II flippase)